MYQFFLQLLKKQTAYCPNTVKEHCKEKTKAYTRHMTNKISMYCREPKSENCENSSHPAQLFSSKTVDLHSSHTHPSLSVSMLVCSVHLSAHRHDGECCQKFSKRCMPHGEKSTSFIGTLHKPTATFLFFFLTTVSDASYLGC